MTATLWLRIAAVIQLLFTIGHSLGGSDHWSPIGETEVLRQMRSFRFDVMRVNRSYLDFFMGFGWSLSVAMLLEAILLWQLASIARTNAAIVRPLIGVFALAMLANGVVAWRLLVPVPAIFSAVLFMVLAVAYSLAGR